MKRIGIIGAGFSGTMTAVHLIEMADERCEIILIGDSATFNTGVAYSTYSDKHLLNVISIKMSAFSARPLHFLEWLMAREDFRTMDAAIIANSFLPRRLYGMYLKDIWRNAVEAAGHKGIKISVIESHVVNLALLDNAVGLQLANKADVSVDICVIATGNHLPRNPHIDNMDFYRSRNYFQNPWKVDAVTDVPNHLPVLIIGNGLTMVDTVLGLLEQGFSAEICSLSPHGFNILPHRHNGLSYSMLEAELYEDIKLLSLAPLVIHHCKMIREYGISAEPVIDSLRPHTQKIWRSLSDSEKRMFMSRFRHFWGVARHRIPLHIHDVFQQLRIEKKLHIKSGKLIDITEQAEGISVRYFDKGDSRNTTLCVSRVINCSGPESDLLKLETGFLKDCVLKGILTQDSLKLGIRTDIATFQTINAAGQANRNVLTLGSNLRGELWESTAVSELRGQAESLAAQLALRIRTAAP